MTTRREFVKKSVAATAAISAIGTACSQSKSESSYSGNSPIFLSTWEHGVPANEKALETINNGGTVLDAVEAGVTVVEADPESMSVGYGGLPDRDGQVTLDACIMDKDGNAGAVCFLQHIMHPISVARLVMEKTPHVMLAGEGALRFAMEQGFEKKNLLTEQARQAWEKWKTDENYSPKANWENHDTIGLIGMDEDGNISGSCTTSGWAYKLHGRVGDSPIIGAGLYVDNDYGAAVATGNGELMMKTLGSFLIVELMRNGRTAQEACEEAIDRIAKKYDISQMQVGYLALEKSGAVGAYALYPGFNYAITINNETNLIDSKSLKI